MSTSVEEARKRYADERGRYEKLAQAVQGEIRRIMSKNHIPCTVAARAKTVSSFVKKAITKSYIDPWEEITDKAGVRIIFEHSGDLDRGLDLVREAFQDSDLEDERLTEESEKRLQYPKVHLQVRFTQVLKSYKGLSCEIQLRTAAQDLWCRMSHSLLYKPAASPSPVVRRSLYRLLALVELYDAEVERGMKEMVSHPDYEEAQLLHEAEGVFHEFVGSDYRLDLSQEVIPVLLQTINSPMEQYIGQLKRFSAENYVKLAEFFRDYGPRSQAGQVGQNFLASQPECIVIFELLSRTPEKLRAKWDDHLPSDWLTEIAESWGVYV